MTDTWEVRVMVYRNGEQFCPAESVEQAEQIIETARKHSTVTHEGQ